MKTLVSAGLAATLIMSTATAYAGGPVVIVDEPEVVAETPRSGVIVPLILVGIVACVVLCGDDDDNRRRIPDIPPTDPALSGN